MKILLINPFQYFSINRHLHRRFPISAITLPYLASFIPSKHTVCIIDEAHQQIDFDTPADLACITTLTVNAHRAYNIAGEFRRRGIKVVMGGPHVSALPDEARQHCDAVAIGNGESTMSKIVADSEAGCLKASYSNAEPSQIPEHVTGYSSSVWQTSVLASRGCELSCDFCSMQNIFGKFYIQRDPASTIEDIRRVRTPIISFVDDNFYGASRASQAFYDQVLDAVAESGKQWMAQVRLPILRKESVLERFRDSNCLALFIGFESINPQNRAAMGKQNVDLDLYHRQIERIHDKGIGVIGSFIFGFDEDTPETIDETVDFCIESRMELTAFSALTPYPGTATFKTMQEQGRLFSTDWRRYDSDQVLFEPNHFSSAGLEQAVLQAVKRFYAATSIFKRLRFGMSYQPYRHYLLPNLLRKYSLMRMRKNG